MNRRISMRLILTALMIASVITALPTQAQEDPAARIHQLALALHEDNIQNQNLTFWVGGTLGVEEFALELIKPGSKMPLFSFAPLFKGDKRLEKANLKGAYLLNFWASWCEPCRMEFPVLEKALKKDQFGIPLYFVNVLDMETEAQDFAATYRKQMTFLLDLENVFLSKHMLQAIPQTWLIGEDGVVQVIHLGNLTEAGADFFEAVIEHPGVGKFDPSDLKPTPKPTLTPLRKATSISTVKPPSGP